MQILNEGVSVNRSARHRLMFFSRLVITSALISLIAVRFDFEAINSQLCSIGSITILSAGMLLVVQMLVLGYRWQRILDASGIATPFLNALRIVLIGSFFNQCLPTSLGGDGVRAFVLRSAGVPLERAVNAVLVDRLSGLAGLLPFLILGAPFLLAWTYDPVFFLADLGITALFSAVLAGYFFGDLLIARIRPVAKLAPLRAVAAASVYAREIACHSPQAIGTAGLAVVVHLTSIVLVVILAGGFSVSLSGKNPATI
jgi:glycosyltransferase 2 family protein